MEDKTEQMNQIANGYFERLCNTKCNTKEKNAIKFASKITLKQTILTEANRVEAEKVYRRGMTMSAIADTFGWHYTTVGRILRQRNVPVREK